jgi:hypothetical protein
MRNVKLNKLWFRLLAVLPLLVLPAARAALLFYEGFDYPKGAELGEAAMTGKVWENDKSQFTVVAGSLEYAGIRAATGNRLNVAATSPSLDSVRTTVGAWPAQSKGVLYLSFLLKIESEDGVESSENGTAILTVGKSANSSPLFGINLRKDDGIKLGVLKYAPGGSPSSAAFFTSDPGASLSANGAGIYLVVAKYEWVDGLANDVVTVWVNPEHLGGDEEPAHKLTTSAGADGTQPASRLTLCRGPHVNIDEIRIGQTWADVTPKSGAAQAASVQ